jgi:hypothetical protein
MTADEYDKIKGLVKYYLFKTHHERHYEDCVQFCALEYFSGRTNVQWTVIDYCRQNGIGERGKLAARPMENATFVGLSSDENEQTKDNGFIFEQVVHEQFMENAVEEDNDCRMSFIGRLEEFLLPIHLKEDTLKWVKKVYQPRLLTREKTYSI